jgi:hypothetical protein
MYRYRGVVERWRYRSGGVDCSSVPLIAVPQPCIIGRCDRLAVCALSRGSRRPVRIGNGRSDSPHEI